MSVYCTLFSQTFYGLLFCYLTITDVHVKLYLQIIDFQFPSCCTSQPPKKLNQIIAVNCSTNTFRSYPQKNNSCTFCVPMFNIDVFDFSAAILEKGLLAQFLFIPEIIISALKKIALFPLFPRYLTLYHLFPEPITLKVSENKGIMQYTFCFTRKTKASSFKRSREKLKIVTFASQRIIEFKQFLTRPNLACSVAKTDRIFFSVLMFHETISN